MQLTSWALSGLPVVTSTAPTPPTGSKSFCAVCLAEGDKRNARTEQCEGSERTPQTMTYLAPNKSFLLVSMEFAFVSGYFAMKHSCVSGQWRGDKPGPSLAAGARGGFQAPAPAGSAGREGTPNSAPGILQQRRTVLQLPHGAPGEGWGAPATMGTTQGWDAEMQLPALGRRTAPSAAPRCWIQTSRCPASANAFISARTEPALSEAPSLVCHAEGSGGLTCSSPQSPASAAPSEGGRGLLPTGAGPHRDSNGPPKSHYRISPCTSAGSGRHHGTLNAIPHVRI